MRMPLNPKAAAKAVESSLGLQGAIVAPLKKLSAKDVNDNKPKAKKKAAPRKKKA